MTALGWLILIMSVTLAVGTIGAWTALIVCLGKREPTVSQFGPVPR